jgi:hypothetical protein
VALRAGPPPWFFVSVASKGFSVPISSLESTLMGMSVSVADKGLRGIVFVGRLKAPETPSGMTECTTDRRRDGEHPLPPMLFVTI